MKLREKSNLMTTKVVRNRRNALLAAAVSAAAVTAINLPSAQAANIVFDGGTAGTSSTWLGTANWNPDGVPGASDIAEFSTLGTAVATVGINLNSAATNNGSHNQIIGEILLSGGPNRVIENSSTTIPGGNGILTISGVAGTIISNTSASSILTIQQTSGKAAIPIALLSSGNFEVTNSGASVVINTPITGSFDFTKTGAGLLTLMGNNTNQNGSNSVNLSAGILNIANTSGVGVSGNITMTAGQLQSAVGTGPSVGGILSLNTASGIVNPGGTGTLGTLALGGLSATGGSNIFNFDLTGAGNDLISLGAGALSLSGTNTLNLSGSGFTPGNYDLLTYGSLSAGSFTLGTNPGGGFSYNLHTDATHTWIAVTSPAQTLTWTGAASNVWTNSAGGPVNWTGGVSNKFQDGDFVTFPAGASHTNPINISVASVKPADVQFSNDVATPYTITGGSIDDSAGPTALTHSGSGVVTLSNSNGYTGATTINGGGTLAIASGNSIGGTSGVSISNASTLAATGTVNTGKVITFGGGGGTIDTGANSITLSSNIAGSGSMTKVGTGTLTLSSNGATFSGATAINGGKISLTSSGAGATGLGTSAVAVNANGTLEFAGGAGTTFQSGSPRMTNITLNDQSTLQGTGTTTLITASATPLLIATTGAVTIKAPASTDFFRLVGATRQAGTGGNQSVTANISVQGNGVVVLGDGGNSESTAGNQYAGSWSVDMGSTGVFALGPLGVGGFGETLNAMGYKAPLVASTPSEGYSGSTDPITVNSGTLAFGSDSRNTRSSLTMLTHSYRSPLTLNGGALASTGMEYGVGGDPNGSTPVTATIASNITITDNSTAKVLLYDPSPATNLPSPNPGGRSLIIGNDAGAVEHDGLNTPVASNMTWGTNSKLEVTAGVGDANVNGGAGYPNVGALKMTRTTETVTVGTGATLKVDRGAVLVTNSLSHFQDSSDSNKRVTIDMNGSMIVQDASSLATVRSLLIQGRGATDGYDNGETWNGAGGIKSSSAAANVFQFGVGYGAVSDMPFSGYTAFAGQTVDANSILIKYTRNGDTDLNGTVDDTDVGAIVTYYKKTQAATAQWAYGDMDYDGQVDDDDVTAMATFYNPNATPISPAQLTAMYGADFAAAWEKGRAIAASGAVPEPASLSILGLGGLAMLARRRRKA